VSQESVEGMRRASALFRAGDLEALIVLYHPDAEWRDPTRWGGTGKQSAATIDLRTADAYLVKEGKIVRAVLSYPDVETAIKAVGLI
jgi:hypothetical protein